MATGNPFVTTDDPNFSFSIANPRPENVADAELTPAEIRYAQANGPTITDAGPQGKNFRAPANVPDTFDNEGPGGGSATGPTDSRPTDNVAAKDVKPGQETPPSPAPAQESWGSIQLPDPEPEHVPVGSGPSVKAAPGSWASIDLSGVDAGTTLATKYQVPPTPGVFADLRHAANYIPSQIFRGMAERWGYPIDLMNFGLRFMANNPNFALASLAQGAEGGFSPGLEQSFAGRQPGPMPPTIPGGGDTIRTLGGMLPLSATASAQELGDQRAGAGLTSNLARGAGQMLSPGVVFKGAELTGKAAIYALKYIGGKLGGGAATLGLGQEAAEDFLGKNGPIPEQVGTMGFAAVLEAARVAAFIALGVGLKGGPSWFGRTVNGLVGPETTFKELTEGTGKAVALRAAQNINNSKLGLPEGYTIPAATASMDAPTQAMFQDLVHRDKIANAQYRALLQGNTASIVALRAEEAGDPAAVAQHLATLQNAMTQNLEHRAQQALDEMNTKFDAATVGVNTDALSSATLQAQKARLLNQELLKWDDDAYDFTRAQWKVAKDSGVTSFPTATTPLYDRVENIASEFAASGHGDSRFPWQVVNQLYEKPLQGAFDRGGELVGSVPARVLKNEEPLDKILAFKSDLEQMARAERKAINSPAMQGDPIRLGYLNRMAEATRGVITTAAEQQGNPAALAAANAATAEYYKMVNQGVIGRVLSSNYEGNALVPPEETLRLFLANGTKGVASANQLFDVINQRQGGPLAAAHPADVMNNQLEAFLRQDFADAYNGSPAAGKRWLANHSGALGPEAPPRFQALGQQFQQALDSKQTYTSLMSTYPKDARDIATSRAGVYLGGEAGSAIDRALAGFDKYAGMKGLISDLRSDPTGRAVDGLKALMFDRLLGEGALPDYSITGFFSGRKVAKWYDANKDAYRALAEVDPSYGDNINKVVNAMQVNDRIFHNPQVVLPEGGATPSPVSVSALGDVAAKIVGAGAMRHMLKGAGSIQSAAIGSNFGGRIKSYYFDRMGVDQSFNLLRDAMFDADKMKLISTPYTAMNDAAQVKLNELLKSYLPGLATSVSQGSVVNQGQDIGPNTQQPVPPKYQRAIEK